MLKAAIVGCGKIADDHAAQIRRIAGCELAAACDTEPLMASQFCERFSVARQYSDLEEMISEVRPDVVHITTPAESHFDVARYCLEHGCHVYIEKPVTLNTRDLRALIALAEEHELKLTAGHDDQFSHVARRMRAMIADGYLGGAPVHMESTFCYNLSDPAYARALLSDKDHWVRRLPGKLLQNLISHGVSRIAEFLTDDAPEIIASGFASPLLQGLGESQILDELRVIIRGKRGTTAYFTFSSQMRPCLHEFRIYGPTNGLILDQDKEMLLRLPGSAYKSYAEKFVPPINFASQCLGEARTNLGIFMKRDFHMKSGMKYLIQAFYGSIAHNDPVPIPYREIVLTSTIMDEIFAQLAPTSTVASGAGRDNRIPQHEACPGRG